MADELNNNNNNTEDISDGINELPMEVTANVKYYSKKSEHSMELAYQIDTKIGTGAFGKVYEIQANSKKYALKRVLQDARFQNRELEMMQLIDHQNVVNLEFYYLDKYGSNTFLNIIMTLMGTNLSSCIKSFSMKNRLIPLILTKLFTFQIAKALAYIHSKDICHRDIKPDNILINLNEGIAALSDFGSAKVISGQQKSLSYICSRSYRAPELLFDNRLYGSPIDLWSFGCVIAEMFLGKVLFYGTNTIEQVVEIVKIIGTPNEEEIEILNPKNKGKKFPEFQKVPWRLIFNSYAIPEEALSLPESLLTYNPQKRVKAINLLGYRFFDELFSPNTTIDHHKPLPSGLFEFTKEELDGSNESVVAKLSQHANFRYIE